MKKQEGQGGPSSLTWVFEITLAFFLISLSEKNLQEFLCLYSASNPHSLIPCLLIDQNFTNNFWKGSLKEHFYEIILKYDQ